MAFKTKIIPLLLLVFITGIFINCKKKTDIKVTIFNPYVQKGVKNAKVSIYECRKTGEFKKMKNFKKIDPVYDQMEEITSSYTDENGSVYFDREKLRFNSRYDYYVFLKEAWGTEDPNSFYFDFTMYPPLNKGKNNDVIICDYTKGSLKMEYNNLFSPAQSGDSLIITSKWFDLYDSRTNSLIQGDGFQKITVSYDANPTWPSNYITYGYPYHAYGKTLLTIRKRKLGALTIDTMTVQFYPQQTTTLTFNW